MSFYERYLLPHFLDAACGSSAILEQREKVVPLAEGRILEIGMGSGINIPYYNPNKVDFVWGLEPSEGMRQKARKNLKQAPFDVKWLDSPSESIPLEDNSVDSILLTYTLCTIPDWQTALEQMRRVLKPSGKLIFCEHGEAPDEKIKKWQERINPAWKKLAGGCHLHRPIPHYLEQGGFKIESMDTRYLPSTPKIAGFNYWGIGKLA
ncbi:methyltransferase type 11 [gamma proteobacterium HTCC5015]|nr:methyltransferase type 11 [gamma proteobacterium HTCC5015]